MSVGAVIEKSKILQKLNENPIENAWAIQDLTLWPERTKFFSRESPRGLSYLLITGHPSQEKYPMVILNDAGGEVEALLEHLPKSPFLIRETRSSVLGKIGPHVPEAQIYYEQRMDLLKENASLPFQVSARRLTEADAKALAQFQGAPPQAAEGMKFWIRGAVIMAVLHEDMIVSMGTTIVRTVDVWDFAGIETRPEFRGKGFASDVVAALSREAFKTVSTVSLTVLKNNVAAIRVYSKLGFQAKEDRVWIDNGTGAKP